VVPVTVAAMTVAAAGVARIAAGRGRGAAGGLSGAGRGRSAAGRLGSAAGRFAAARLATTTTIEQAGLGVVGKQRNGAACQQQSKQNLRFHGSPQKGEQDVYFAATRRVPSNALATRSLIGSNRQTLRVALTGQTGFAICWFLTARRSCGDQREV
jgi:hypothetical protein